MNIKQLSLCSLLLAASVTQINAMRTQKIVPKKQALHNWEQAHEDCQKKWLEFKATQKYRQFEYAQKLHAQKNSEFTSQVLITAINIATATKESQLYFQSIDTAQNLLKKIPGEPVPMTTSLAIQQ